MKCIAYLLRINNKDYMVKLPSSGFNTCLIHLYRNFTRIARAGDLDLYVSCLPEITNTFFAMNHLIYARWLVKYYDSLTRLPDTLP